MVKQIWTFGHWSLIRHSSLVIRYSSFVIRHWPLLVLGAFTLALLLPYTLTGFIFTGDVRDVYLPLEHFYRDELRAGRLPLWDPEAALGFPTLASAQLGFWYPPLLLLRVLPPEPALALAMLAHVFFLGVGVLAFSRTLGHSRSAALLSAVAFTGSGFLVGHFVHSNILFGVAWLPWALLLTDWLAASLKPRHAVHLSMVLALAALAGHFQITAIMAALCLARFVARVHARVRRWQHTLWTTGLLCAPALLAVVLLSAAQLFPTIELIRESSRGAKGSFDVAQANQHSFAPWQAVTFIVPAFFGFPDLSQYWGTRPQIEMTAWVGTLPLLLAVVGALAGKHQTPMTNDQSSPNARIHETRIGHGELGIGHFWTATAAIGFLLALGKWSPLRLVGVEPTLGIFSGPARYLLLTEFSLALLAGRGLDQLRKIGPMRPIGQIRPIRPIGLLGLATALLLAASFLLLRTQPDFVRRAGVAAVDRFIVGRPSHVLTREAYVKKVEYLVDRLGTWGVNLGNPAIALSVVLLAAGSTILIFQGRGNAIILDSASAKRRKDILLALVAATAFELVALAWQVHPRVAWQDVSLTPPVVSVLRDRPRGRLYTIRPPGDTGLLLANRTTRNRDEHERLVRDLAGANVPTRYGIPVAEWPAALDLARAAAVLDRAKDELGRPRDGELLDRLGVRYVAATSATPNLSVPDDRPLATFPSGESRAITVWERASPHPKAELLADLPASIFAPLPPSAGQARIVRDTPQKTLIEVENTLDSDAFLVFRETHYPGWRATVDGTSVPLDRADTLFRGVRIPTGEHSVAFRYRPLPAYTGMAVSAAAWLAAGALLARRRAKGKGVRSRFPQRPRGVLGRNGS